MTTKNPSVTPTMQDSKLPPAREPQSSPADEFKNWWKNFVWSADSTPEQLARLAWQASASQSSARIAELEKQIEEHGKPRTLSLWLPKEVTLLTKLEEVNAARAVMWGALNEIVGNPDYTNPEAMVRIAKEALSGTAGKELLEERDRLREQVKQAAWISVKERLPKGGAVLCATRGRSFVGYYHEGRWWEEGQKLIATITHWMPLPAPPSEVSIQDKKADPALEAAASSITKSSSDSNQLVGASVLVEVAILEKVKGELLNIHYLSENFGLKDAAKSALRALSLLPEVEAPSSSPETPKTKEDK